jgi:hypothetical protein
LLLKTPDRKEFPFILQHELKGREEFDVGLLLPQIRVRDPQKEAQLHYLIRLSLSATDNNIETGNDPAKGGSTRRSEPSIPLLVVTETELLTQVALEEEVIAERMDKVIFKLRNSQTSLSEQVAKLTSEGVDLERVALRTDEVRKYVMDGSSNCKEMLNDYLRILKELQVNRVRDDKIKSVDDKIITKLEAVLAPKGNFNDTEEAVTKLYDATNRDFELKREDNRLAHHQSAQQAQFQLNLLITRLNDISREMATGVDWAKSQEAIVAIEREQRRLVENVQRWYGEKLQELFKDLQGPPK